MSTSTKNVKNSEIAVDYEQNSNLFFKTSRARAQKEINVSQRKEREEISIRSSEWDMRTGETPERVILKNTKE